MKEIELYWTDLTEKAQNEIREMLHLAPDDDNNWTFIPMATIPIEDDDTSLG